MSSPEEITRELGARTLVWLTHCLLYSVQDVLVAADANRTDRVRYWRFGAQVACTDIANLFFRH
jgi:hypothetical protein